MRPLSFALISVALSFLCGCEGGNGATPVPELAVDVGAPAQRPDLSFRSRLALLDNGRRLGVGDPVQEALEFLPAPRKAYAFRELPPGFEEPYRAEGWETDAEGFGVISLDGKVVLTLRTQEDASQTLIEETVRAYTRDNRSLPPERVTGQAAESWFFERESHRLMIAAVKDPNGKRSLTLALGDVSVMDALRMSPAKALQDRDGSSPEVES